MATHTAMHAATHSTVAFPIDAFRRRIERLAAECRGQVLAALPTDAIAADVAAAVRQFLRDRRFAVPDYGRSALPPDSVVDHGAAPPARGRTSYARPTDLVVLLAAEARHSVVGVATMTDRALPL